jgi:hypothetical protein
VEKYFSRNSFCCGLIGIFALLLWGQTVSYDFVWDDQIYITQNKSIRSLANIPKIFSRQEAQSAENPSISYRPLRNTVYAILTALGGEATPKAWIFHLANVLWHATASILLFLVALLLCERLTRNDSVALGSAVVSTAVFGVSPKTFAVSDSARFGVGEIVIDLAGGTPAKATGTVALPTASFRLSRGIPSKPFQIDAK